MIIGKPKKKSRALPIILLAVAAVAGLTVLKLVHFWHSPAQEPGHEVVLTVPAGATFVAASQLLVDAGVVKSLKPFVLLGKVKGLSSSIQAGELMFRTDMTPLEVLDILVRGKAVSYPVTIPEGYNSSQIAALLAGRGIVDEERFKALIGDADFARSLDVPADGLEGFLFPDTYSLPRGLSEEEILARMVKRYKEVFNARMAERAREIGMTELEVVTLASIVEKETGAPEERRHISAVFHNRLKKGYRLQTDPTVIYGIKEFNGNLTKKDLRTDHPYNTYTRGGLPHGPIANPGEASILAALYPEDVPSLYFVARGDGTHVFSNTLVEHNQAVKIYQLGEIP
ncbi:MAG: endolytic transglycosylase MltG [bacterium]|nr:endolytic transglycosylase MltG [bacterium]